MTNSQATQPIQVNDMEQTQGVPVMKLTDRWDSARVADYNAGWNACRDAMLSAAPQAQPHSLISDEQYLQMFMDAKAGSEKPVGYLRGIRRVIAAYEGAAPQTQPVAEVQPKGMHAGLVRALAERRFRGATDADDLYAMAANVIREDGQVIAGQRAIIDTLKGQSPAPAPAQPVEAGETWDETQLDGIFDAIKSNCGPATAGRVRAILVAHQAQPAEAKGASDFVRWVKAQPSDREPTTIDEALAEFLDQVKPAQPVEAEPLFILHCGQIDSSGEQDEWCAEANGQQRVDEFCRQHPGQTVKLHPHAQPVREPMSDEQIEALRQQDDCGEDVPEFARIVRIAERACADRWGVKLASIGSKGGKE